MDDHLDKKLDRKTREKDLRIHATPHQVAASFFKNDPPRKAIKNVRTKRKASAWNDLV